MRHCTRTRQTAQQVTQSSYSPSTPLAPFPGLRVAIPSLAKPGAQEAFSREVRLPLSESRDSPREANSWLTDSAPGFHPNLKCGAKVFFFFFPWERRTIPIAANLQWFPAPAPLPRPQSVVECCVAGCLGNQSLPAGCFGRARKPLPFYSSSAPRGTQVCAKLMAVGEVCKPLEAFPT